jgi:hypothetical protein
MLLFLYRPNLLDSHMALMLLTFIDAGFLEVICMTTIRKKTLFCSFIDQAITEIAISDNTILSIRATLLLANFIWLVCEKALELFFLHFNILVQ